MAKGSGSSKDTTRGRAVYSLFIQPLANSPRSPGQPDARAGEPREGDLRLCQPQHVAGDEAEAGAAGQAQPGRRGPRVYSREHGNRYSSSPKESGLRQSSAMSSALSKGIAPAGSRTWRRS